MAVTPSIPEIDALLRKTLLSDSFAYLFFLLPFYQYFKYHSSQYILIRKRIYFFFVLKIFITDSHFN